MTSRIQLLPTLVFTVCALSIGGTPSAAQSSDENEPPAEVAGEAVEAQEGVETDETPEAEQDPDVAELQRRLDILAEEVERLRSGEVDEVVELSEDDTRALGLAPSAAATYERGRGVSIAGYGEMLYENFAGENQAGAAVGKTTQLDYLRAIIYAGYRFNDQFLFNSEIEVEHGDEVFIEFAYIDYLVNEHFGIRGGMLLVPMGLVNEFHEPNVFMGAERPVTEQVIIPSTWRENGGGVYGSVDQVSFRAYVINGLNGANFSSAGVRGGRQKGSKAKASSMAFTGRVDITPTPGVFLGTSFYSGGSGHGEIVLGADELGIQTTIFDIHGQAQVRGFDVRGLYARASIGDAAELNMALGKTGTSAIAETLQGGYMQVGYNLLSQVPEAGGVSLAPYLRLEKVDTQGTVPVGFARSLSTDNVYTTVGVELKPIPNVVLKVDHMWVRNDADSGVNQLNIALGYAF